MSTLNKNRAAKLGVEDRLRGYNKGKRSFFYGETRIYGYTIVLKSLVITQLERDAVLSCDSNSQHLNIWWGVGIGARSSVSAPSHNAFIFYVIRTRLHIYIY